MQHLRASLKQALRARPYLFDTAVAVFVYAVILTATSAGPGPGPELTPGLAVTGAVVCGALAFRRRWPLGVLAVTVTGTVVHDAVASSRSPLILVAVVAAFSAATLVPRRTAWIAGTAAALTLAVSRMLASDETWLHPEIVGLVAWLGMATAAGDALRSRRAYVAAIEERARRAEQTREEEAERRVMEERLRIARELHDVLAHHIALINVQSQVAAHVLDDEPAQAREALGHIRLAGRAALEELRTTVGLLRRPGSQDEPLNELVTEPAPGLDRLDDLIGSFTAAGLAVDFRTEGDPRPLPAPVELAAFRVTQEALTNVSKHAPRARATVRIAYTPRDLVVDVADDGGPLKAPPGAGPAGHGLVGMRERALSVGGTFTTGPSVTGGFRVLAVLPAALGVSTP
ncbi:sensor histidine kinase [Planotetraspora kaengkrachanensis]|uniref:histidine kinase n=1 Tax=Planotetraspora kaengkrachanensis TaxID=575193 RepID=A0A8J3LYX5_9ACTN|nr:sensor histidine kinase [Planotetraspora kaengkrachanensis]GIG80474.1 two-component sensor histidine kinase [Planotetraspora kaengkrachanensis]